MQWTFRAAMINQFEGQEYWAICEEGGGQLDDLMFIGIPQDAINAYNQFYECQPIKGEDVLGM
jgi:hypothetical protein